MFEFLAYDLRKRLKGSVYLTVGMGLLTSMMIWVYPSFGNTFEGDELLDAYPPQLVQLFDIRTIGSLEGFLAFELYVFGWVILLGLYVAYSAANIVAEEIDRGRMDALLAMPVSRRRLLGEKFAALGLPIGLVNVAIPPVVIVGAGVIDEPISAADVAVLHLLSVPYLFACASIGLLASVVFDRASVAQRVALGVTFALFLTESVLTGTQYELVGAIAPMRYFDPNAVLLDGSYDFVGAAILVVTTATLLLSSQLWFRRKDI